MQLNLSLHLYFISDEIVLKGHQNRVMTLQYNVRYMRLCVNTKGNLDVIFQYFGEWAGKISRI